MSAILAAALIVGTHTLALHWLLGAPSSPISRTPPLLLLLLLLLPLLLLQLLRPLRRLRLSIWATSRQIFDKSRFRSWGCRSPVSEVRMSLCQSTGGISLKLQLHGLQARSV